MEECQSLPPVLFSPPDNPNRTLMALAGSCGRDWKAQNGPREGWDHLPAHSAGVDSARTIQSEAPAYPAVFFP